MDNDRLDNIIWALVSIVTSFILLILSPLLVMVSPVVFDEVHHVDWTTYCIVSYLLFSPAVFLTMLTMSITNVFRKDYIKKPFFVLLLQIIWCVVIPVILYAIAS